MRINFNEFFREMKCSLSLGRIQVIRVRVNQVKMTEKWGKIHGKLDLIRVSGEFELFEFELSGFYSTCKPVLENDML